MATPTTREDILELLRKSGVLKPERLQQFLDAHPNLPGDPKAVAAQFVQAKLLTPFQAKLLLAGRYKGFRLGAYVLLDQIGQGGMGAVYLAEHDTLHRKAAIKVLPPGGNKLTIERFLREARSVAALDHPNIVRLHDVGREGEVHFLVMEHVEGQTLDKVVGSTAPLPAVKAVEYIAQACAGLQHAYERGFIHRDIKPANLILSKDGTIKILDMGLARSNEQHDQLTQNLDAGAIVGTADYISPEQAINDPGVDIRTDIYSLGATFFAVVTGRPPFDGPTASKLVQHQVKDPPSVSTLDRTFPKGLSTVIAKMMAKKPADRYATPSEVIEALQPWQNESAKLLAGLTQTKVGQTNALNKMTGRLNPVTPKKKGRGLMFAVLGGLAAAVLLVVGIIVAMSMGGNGSAQSKTGPTKPASTETVATQPTPPATAPKPTVPTTKPEVAPPDPPVMGSTLFTFDADDVADFNVVKEKQKAIEGTDPMLPTGVSLQSYKIGSKAEFRCEPYAGKRSIAMFSVHGMASGQMVFDLEDKIKLPIAIDKGYIATIEFAMAGQGTGVFTAAGPSPSFVKLASAPLSATLGKYERRSVSFVRRPGMPVRLAVDVSSTGAENALFVHKVEVAEDLRPVPAPIPNRVVYDLPLAKAKPVTVTVLTFMDGQNKTQRELKRTPADVVAPLNWRGHCYLPEAECEYEVGEALGVPALGVRTAKNPPNAKGNNGMSILFSPRFECPSGYARVKFEYLAPVKGTKATLKLKLDGAGAVQVAVLPTPTSGWATFEQVLDLKQKATGQIEVTNAGDVGETIWLKSFTVSEATADDLPKKK